MVSIEVREGKALSSFPTAAPGGLAWTWQARDTRQQCASSERCRVLRGRCSVPHNTPSLDTVKAHVATNAQMHTGGRIYPPLNHRDLKDLLHYLCFPEKYLNSESGSLSQAGPSLFGTVGDAFDFS